MSSHGLVALVLGVLFLVEMVGCDPPEPLSCEDFVPHEGTPCSFSAFGYGHKFRLDNAGVTPVCRCIPEKP